MPLLIETQEPLRWFERPGMRRGHQPGRCPDGQALPAEGLLLCQADAAIVRSDPNERTARAEVHGEFA